jgi:fluoride exporter
MIYFWVFLGGGLGSISRLGISRMVASYSQNFPYGTLLSNLLASAILALVVYQLPNKSGQEWLPYFLVIGFCGGFSTFSTFSHELVLLINNAQWFHAAAYLLISILFGVATIWMISSKI